ncbi:MAG: hypothetical protein J6I40_01035 [Mailhella sp.]|nr:hypothetical protein [Mailhella sp.]
MLTESEKRWLKARKLRQAKHHLYHRNEYYVWSGYHPAKEEINDLREAAEFEARVAAKLAELYGQVTGFLSTTVSDDCRKECPCWKICQGHDVWRDDGCRFKILRYARIIVDEEMDADRK